MPIITSLDLQSLNDMEGRITSVGHGFAEGDLAAGAQLTATVAGAEVAVQMDVLSTWPDGSVKHAIVSFDTPHSEDGTATLILENTQSTDTGVAALDIAGQAAALDYDFSVTVDGETIDIATLLQTGPVDMWQSGSLVSQGRVTHTLANGLELRADITVRADGTIDTSVIMGNDNIETTGLDALTYGVEITQNGNVVFSDDALTQYHFTVWREGFSTATATNTTHAVYDMDYLRGTGLVPLVDTALTLKDGDYYGEVLADPNATYDPLELGGIDNNGGIDEDRGRSGTSKSYGIITDDQHSYLVTQTAAAREGMLALTDQYGAFSDFYRNPETGEAYLLEDTDFNSFHTGVGKDVAGTDGVVDLTNDGLALRNKQSHDPSAFYTSFLVTGDRFYADGLLSEGGSSHLLWANAATLTGDGLVDFGSQLRSQAWSLRDLFQSATLAPDGSHAKPVLEARLEAALQEYVDYYIGGETLTSLLGREFTGSREAAAFSEGPLAGVLQSYNGTALDRPYWQDWFGMVIGQIAATGNENAIALGEWMANFSAGRFLQDDFDPTNSLFSLTGSANGSRSLTGDLTWAELQALAGTGGVAGSDDWDVDGFYTAAAFGGTASLLNGTRDERYAEALLWMTGALSQQAEDVATGNGTTTQFAIPVQFLDNSIVGITERTLGTELNDALVDGDGNRLIVAGAGNDTVTTGAGNHLVDGGDGNDTLTGGDGEDWLFGGSGADRLSGGAGVNILQGDRHDVDFGRFADTFAFDTVLGETRVIDFTVGQDILEFTGFDLEGNPLDHFTSTSEGVTLDIDGPGSLLLEGVTLEDLQENGIVSAGSWVSDDELLTITYVGDQITRQVSAITEADGDVRATAYDGTGKRESFTFDDISDSRNWETYTNTYDDAGGLTNRDWLYDNGNIRTQSYADRTIVRDVTTETDGDVRTTLYGANGKRESFTVDDISDSRNWETYTNSYDEAGVLTGRTRLFDNGNIRTQSYVDGVIVQDVMTETDGDVRTTLYGANGRRESFTVDDISDSRNWETYTNSYDEAGVLTGRTRLFDNGNIRTQSYADGVIAQDVTTEADGDARTTAFDEAGNRLSVTLDDFSNSRDWESYTNTYSETGTLTSQTLTYDTGDVRTTLYRTNGQRESATFEDISNSRGWESYTNTYDETGTITGQHLFYDTGDVRTQVYVDGVLSGSFTTDADTHTLASRTPDISGDTITGPGWLNGTGENDHIVSGGANIRLQGGDGHDHIISQHWAVRIQGGDGNDLLESRDDAAILYGDDGEDTFLFRSRVDGEIVDFNSADDLIAFESATTGYATFADVTAAIVDSEDGLSLVSANGDALLLRGVREAALTEDLVLFV